MTTSDELSQLKCKYTCTACSLNNSWH